MRLLKIGERFVNLDQVLFIDREQETRERRVASRGTAWDGIKGEVPAVEEYRVRVFTLHFGIGETIRVPDEHTPTVEAFLKGEVAKSGGGGREHY